ncbi:hypothetical protein TNCV_2528881 [Trichonephila clavipes]|nr:hypothetical protein TNCV_2528881 [Trichonephila clavipes]
MEASSALRHQRRRVDGTRKNSKIVRKIRNEHAFRHEKPGCRNPTYNHYHQKFTAEETLSRIKNTISRSLPSFLSLNIPRNFRDSVTSPSQQSDSNWKLNTVIDTKNMCLSILVALSLICPFRRKFHVGEIWRRKYDTGETHDNSVQERDVLVHGRSWNLPRLSVPACAVRSSRTFRSSSICVLPFILNILYIFSCTEIPEGSGGFTV